MNRNRPIVLLFPPHGNIFFPYLSLPTLSGWLRAHGYKVVQQDWGMETFDWLLSAQTLSRLRPRLEPADDADYLIKGIDEAKRILRTESLFFQPALYAFAHHTISRALELISLAYHPTLVMETVVSFEGDLTLDRVLELSTSQAENPFLEYLECAVDSMLCEHVPAVVGISISFAGQIVGGFTVARLIRERAPQVHICIGGEMVAAGRSQILDDPRYFDLADSFVVGEGETALEALARFYCRGDVDSALPPNVLRREDSRVPRKQVAERLRGGVLRCMWRQLLHPISRVSRCAPI